MNMQNSLSKELRYTDHFDLAVPAVVLIVSDRYGVAHEHFGEGGVFQQVARSGRKSGVCGTCVHGARSSLEQHLGGGDECSSRHDHVVYDKSRSAFDVAYHLNRESFV